MNKFKPDITDEEARRFIVDEIKTNIFVEAGAGSGKTTMLVNRMVAMIESGIPVEKICAITFTKNAALEFYKRFQEKLTERTNPKNDKPVEHAGDLGIPTDIGRSRCKQALENIDLCFMGTIDSFCNMVLSEHPTEANIPSNARLVSNEEVNTEYRKFYVDVRQGSYGLELKELADRFAIFFRNSEDMFAHLMSEIMNRRNVTFHFDTDLCIDFNECFGNQIKDLRKVLNVFAKDKKKINLNLKDEEADQIEIFNNANASIQRNWEYNYQGIQYALKEIKDISYPGSCQELGFINELVVRDEQGGSTVSLNIADEENKDTLIPKLNNYKYQNTLNFLIQCVQPLEELMRKEGKFTFTDYLLFLRDMLVNDSKKEGKLIEYIYNRHSYFLIDEFQDTNPIQAEIFFYLAAKDPKKKSWKECEPKDGSLFIVGDPKQSIYRFRSADVSSYISIRELFEKNTSNCAVVYLDNNFRSKNVLKTYFNNVFEEVMSDDSNSEQSKYREIGNLDSKENIDEFTGIYKYESATGSYAKEDSSMSDSNQICNVILSIMNSDKMILDTDKNSNTYNQLRKIKYSDFMVIFFNKKAISECLVDFKEYGIPSKAEGKVLFSESEALRIIVSIYKAVTLLDPVALIEVLKSPVFGLNENDIADYKSKGNEIQFDLTKDYDDSKVGICLRKLSDTVKAVSSQTSSSLFEKIIDDYEIFKYVSSENLEVVYYALELLRNAEISGEIVSYEDGYNYLEELIEGDSDIERCLSLKQNIDAIHIANLHKVKGLEAPIVILAKSGVNNNIKANIRVEYVDDPLTGQTLSNGYICSISDPNNSFNDAIETNSHELEKKNEVASLKAEKDRLIYVAATRARNALIINDTLQKTKSGKISSTGKKNQWHYLLDKATDSIFNIVETNMSPIGKDYKEVNANDLYKEDDLTKLVSKPSYSFNKPSDIKTAPIDKEEEVIEANNDSTLIGTIVHRLMEMIILSKDKISKNLLVDNILNEYIKEEYLPNIQKYKTILENVYEKIHQGGYPQKNDAPQDILKELMSADEVYSEVPFTYKDNKGIWNGIIDALYVKDNKAYIIDWKTNKDDSDLDDHYKSQLEAYKSAVKETIGVEVEKALIYHIAI